MFCPRFLFFAALPLASALIAAPPEAKHVKQDESYGTTTDGRKVSLFTLRNDSGMEVSVTNFGATITAIRVADKSGNPGDVALGFTKGESYVSGKNTPYFGATVGRYGNRIAGGKFEIDGKQYTIPTNDKPRPNALHGGPEGFNSKLWDLKELKEANGSPKLTLHYRSPDGEEGFPGNLDSTVSFTVGKDNSLRIDYTATTDKATVLNLTNHTYFNLEGPAHSVLNHTLMLAADRYTPTDKNLIPTGRLESVAGSPFDFRKATRIGERIADNHPQIKIAGGYDHNFVLNRPGSGLKQVSARVESKESGRVMEVYTTEPGIQFYSANFLDGSIEGVGGHYEKNSALCLETQHFPDSPNHPGFPSTLLRPGKTFRSTTIYKFSVVK